MRVQNYLVYLRVWIGLIITRLPLALTYNDTISWTHLRLSDSQKKACPSLHQVSSLFSHARIHCLSVCRLSWPFHPPTTKLLVFSYIIVLRTWWAYKCVCVCVGVTEWWSETADMHMHVNVFVCVCYMMLLLFWYQFNANPTSKSFHLRL